MGTHGTCSDGARIWYDSTSAAARKEAPVQCIYLVQFAAERICCCSTGAERSWQEVEECEEREAQVTRNMQYVL